MLLAPILSGLTKPHLVVDLGDRLFGDGPSLLAALVQYLLYVTGLGFNLCPTLS